MKKGKFVLITMHYPSVFLVMETEDYMYAPCKIMKKAGYEVEILTLRRQDKPDEEIVRDVKVKRFSNTASLLHYVYKDPNIVLVHTILRPFLPSLLAAFLPKPKIMTPNTFEPGSTKLIAAISIALMKRFDRLFNITPYEREIYKKAGIPNEKLELLPFPIDYDFFTKNVGKKQALRKKWKLKDEEFVVVTTCNIKSVKNVDTMLKACAEAKKTVPKIKFILVGPDSLGSKRYKDTYQKDNFNLQALVKKLNIGSNIKLTGALEAKYIRELLQAADCFINTSSIESQSISVYEAAASATPLCLSQIGSFTSVFKELAKFNKPRDHKALANNLVWYAQHEKEAKELGKKLKTKVKDWDYKKTEKRMLEIFKQVMKN